MRAARWGPWRRLVERLAALRFIEHAGGSWLPLLLSLLLVPIFLAGVFARGPTSATAVTMTETTCDTEQLSERLVSELGARGLRVVDRVSRPSGGVLVVVADPGLVDTTAGRDPFGVPTTYEAIVVDRDPARRARFVRQASSPLASEALARLAIAVERARACEPPQAPGTR